MNNEVEESSVGFETYCVAFLQKRVAPIYKAAEIKEF